MGICTGGVSRMDDITIEKIHTAPARRGLAESDQGEVIRHA